MGKLEGKVALITGGSSGIGFATAQRFLAEGAYVYVTGRRPEKLDQAVARLGERAIGVAGDVARTADLDRLFAQIAREHGRLDVVFANAAAMDSAPITAIDEAHVERLIGPNLRGVLFTVQKALALMPDGGAIVLTGSLGASHGWPDQTVYAATKAAVRSFARTWTTELKARGIRVNVVSPGATTVEGTDQSGDGDAHHEELAALIPAGRTAHPDEIAAVVTFLASEDARYVRGVELFADGGLGQV